MDCCHPASSFPLFMKTSPVLLALLTGALLPSCGSGEEAQTTPEQRITRAPRTLSKDLTQPATSTLPVRQEGPIIEFESLEKNFGQVPDTESLKYGFKFKNTGTDTLNVYEIKPSCGCTTTTLSRTSFAPGEGDVIDIVWEPKGHGKQRKNIQVRTNSKRAPILQLNIQAEIEPFLQVTPNRADFGLVQRQSAPELFLEVTCQDPEMELLEARSTTTDLQVTIVEPAQNGRAKLRVVLSESRASTGVRRFFPKLVLKARARLEGADLPIEHEHEVPVLATLYDQLAPEPAIFPVGRITPGRSVTKQLVVSRPSGEPFEISQASLKNFQPTEGTTVRYEKLGANYRVTLTCKPGAYEGPIRGQVALTTNLPEEPTLLLDVYGVSGPPLAK
jgi:hypothetical protein